MFEKLILVCSLAAGLCLFPAFGFALELPQDVSETVALANSEVAANDENGLLRMSRLIDDLQQRRDFPDAQRNRLIWSIACDLWIVTLRDSVRQSLGYPNFVSRETILQVRQNFLNVMEVPGTVTSVDDLAVLYQNASCRSDAMRFILVNVSPIGSGGSGSINALVYDYVLEALDAYGLLVAQSAAVIAENEVSRYQLILEAAQTVIYIGDFYQARGELLALSGISTIPPETAYSDAEQMLLTAQQNMQENSLDQGQVWFDVARTLVDVFERTNNYNGYVEQAARAVNTLKRQEGASGPQVQVIRQQYEAFLGRAPDPAHLAAFRRLIE